MQWITSGMYADYFLTLVRTEDGKFSMLVVPNGQGVSLTHMKMSGSGSAGTAFVDFDDVRVPKENIVGREGEGLRQVMSNFNREVRKWEWGCGQRLTVEQRLFIGFQSLRLARVCLEDTIR